MHRVVEFLVSMSRRKHSLTVRTLATLLGAALFIGGIPALVFWAGEVFTNRPIFPVSLSRLLSVACFVLGLPWVAWAVFWQLTKGKGTPVPVIPTKHFLKNGPYRFVRNPMMLGFFLYLLGLIYRP